MTDSITWNEVFLEMKHEESFIYCTEMLSFPTKIISTPNQPSGEVGEHWAADGRGWGDTKNRKETFVYFCNVISSSPVSWDCHPSSTSVKFQEDEGLMDLHVIWGGFICSTLWEAEHFDILGGTAIFSDSFLWHYQLLWYCFGSLAASKAPIGIDCTRQCVNFDRPSGRSCILDLGILTFTFTCSIMGGVSHFMRMFPELDIPQWIALRRLVDDHKTRKAVWYLVEVRLAIIHFQLSIKVHNLNWPSSEKKFTIMYEQKTPHLGDSHEMSIDLPTFHSLLSPFFWCQNTSHQTLMTLGGARKRTWTSCRSL